MNWFFRESSLYVPDLTKHLQNGCIVINTYSKPINSHLYLPFSSSHPNHCKRTIPHCVAFRIKHSCSNITPFLKSAAKEYKGYLKQQEYNSKLSNSANVWRSTTLPRRFTQAVHRSTSEQYICNLSHPMIFATICSLRHQYRHTVPCLFTVITGHHPQMVGFLLTEYLGGSNRIFRPIRLSEHPWMVYSDKVDGIFCVECATFASYRSRGNSVYQPFRLWQKKG